MTPALGLAQEMGDGVTRREKCGALIANIGGGLSPNECSSVRPCAVHDLATEFAWLIEHTYKHAWWNGQGTTSFTRDPSDVVRFARKEDAERVAAWLNYRDYRDGVLTATEHTWIGASNERAAFLDEKKANEQ